MFLFYSKLIHPPKSDLKNMANVFEKLGKQRRNSVRSQIFVGFLLVCSCHVFINAGSPINAHSVGRRNGRRELSVNEGISHLLHGAIIQSEPSSMCLSFPSPTRTLICLPARTTSASPAEFDGTNRGLKCPEATQACCKAFKTKKICRHSSKVILTK